MKTFLVNKMRKKEDHDALGTKEILDAVQWLLQTC